MWACGTDQGKSGDGQVMVKASITWCGRARAPGEASYTWAALCPEGDAEGIQETGLQQMRVLVSCGWVGAAWGQDLVQKMAMRVGLTLACSSESSRTLRA